MTLHIPDVRGVLLQFQIYFHVYYSARFIDRHACLLILCINPVQFY